MYKKILQISTTIITLSLFSGCSVKENSNLAQLFTKDDIYHVSLVNTHKAQLIASLETKALLTATYLNPVYKSEKCKNFCMNTSDGEYFFVGVFVEDSKTNEFNKKGYLLTLNGQKPTSIKLLDKNDPLRYEMPMMNNWSTYYKVKFPKVEGEKLILTFENDRFGKDTLIYPRDQKPLFDPLEGLSKLHN